MEISTSGAIDFIAVGGAETVNIEVLTITGPAVLRISAQEVTLGFLNIEDGSLQIDDADADAGDEGETCSIPSDGGITISIFSPPIVIDTSASCNFIGVQLVLPDGFVSQQVLELHPVSVEEPDNTEKNENETGDSSKGSVSFFYLFMLMLFLPSLYLRRR